MPIDDTQIHLKSVTKMPDNTIQLWSRVGRESDKAQGQKDADEKKAASDRIRAESMRRRLNDKKMVDKVPDRIQVAINLGHILNELNARGHTSKNLLRDLRMGKEGDSTKQLYNYVLPEDAALEHDSKRVRALTKRASKYLRIAEGAAKLMDGDPHLMVLRLFANTSYQIDDDVPDEKIATMEQMRGLLVGMTEAAVRRHDLGRYLEMLGSGKIGWDIDGSFGNYRSLAIDVFFKDRAARHVSYLGYAPTVFLYRRGLEPVTPIEGEAFQIDFDSDPDAVRKFLREDKPLPRKHRMPVSLSISREIWFGIGPMETGWMWKPIFEKRLSFHIRGHQGRDRSLRVSSYDPTIVLASKMHSEDVARPLLWLHQFTLLPRCPSGESLSFSVSPHIDTSESVGFDNVQREHLEDRWLITLDRFDSQSLSVDQDIDATKGQFFYEAVDLASCLKYLDQVADPDDWEEFESECASVVLNDDLWSDYEEREAWYQDFSFEGWPAMHLEAPKGSIARAIEQNLLCGEVGRRLDSALFEAVGGRIQAAGEYYQRVLQNRESQIAELLNSWKEA